MQEVVEMAMKKLVDQAYEKAHIRSEKAKRSSTNTKKWEDLEAKEDYHEDPESSYSGIVSPYGITIHETYDIDMKVFAFWIQTRYSGMRQPGSMFMLVKCASTLI